jgi:acetyl esterase
MTNLQYDSRRGPSEREIMEFLAVSDRFFPEGTPGAGQFPVLRQQYEALCRHFHAGRPPSISVMDVSIPGPAGPITIRKYRSDTKRLTGGLIYFHGGGFVLGSLDSHDDVCCGFAKMAGVTVLAVNYRLAPEHRFPAAFEDCTAAAGHIFEHAASLGLDPGRIAVGGDSAGGNLCAAVCLARRDHSAVMPAGQILIYPALGGDMTKGSYVARANAPGLTTRDMAAFESYYSGPAGHDDNSIQFRWPLRARDFRGLPPAFMIACEWDPLRDDCFDYQRLLRNANIEAVIRHERELIHGCLRARHVSPAARAMFKATAEALKKLTSGPPRS